MNFATGLGAALVMAALLTTPAAAQDVTPAIDPATVGQSNATRGTMQGHAVSQRLKIAARADGVARADRRSDPG